MPVVSLPDVQANKPEIPVNLTRVGVTNVKKLVEITRNNRRPIILISTFDIFVDLPLDRKGANLSRNFEAVDSVIEEAVKSPVYGVEELCGAVARKLLDQHEYANRAEVRMKSEYAIKRKTPYDHVTCQEIVDMIAEATAIRGEKTIVRKLIGAEVLGITACPCAQEIMQDKAINELEKLGISKGIIERILEKIPMATHNQRGRGTITIEVHDGVNVPLDKIIHIIEDSMSATVYEFLKRGDEVALVEQAHRNPKFVEDCVRTMVQKIVEEFKQLPEDTIVTIKQINEESIHRHNAFAERTATIKELRDELWNEG
ncbi:MAG: GTP cyclohydrolase I FolE2 [Methanosarcinales archaeon]|nr:MAG: GTP cyclohydrolase I FolE2 [Methanosarcinales archaeon]